MKRYGAVIVFKAGVSKAQAERVIADMANEVGGLIEDHRTPAGEWPSGVKYPAYSGVNEFDDDMGGPVWYVP